MAHVFRPVPGKPKPNYICIVSDSEAFEWAYAKNPCPDDNRNEWLFRFGLDCMHAGISFEYAVEAITAKLNRPPKGHGEVLREVRRAYNCAPWLDKPGREIDENRIRRSEVPAFNPELLKTEADKLPFEISSDWLRKRSPVAVSGITPAKFLDLIFPDEKPLVSINMMAKGGFVYENQSEADELNRFTTGNKEGCWYLANSISGEEIDGSIRSERNLTSFRHAVLESDNADPKRWLAMIVQRSDLRIKAITWSGNRSIHVLVDTGANNKKQFNDAKRKLIATFCVLGADPGALSSVRLTRLPNVIRNDSGRLQALLYLNPRPIAKPIWFGNNTTPELLTAGVVK